MIAYFDCFSGMSGDMTLGALVDAGVPLQKLRAELARIPLKGYQLSAKRVKRAGLRATKVDVVIKETGGKDRRERKWQDIRDIINGSTLPAHLKQKGLSIFKRLFEAEARVHGGRYNTIHLHELGAIDCIVDILGSLIGLDILGIDTIYASALNLGSGSIKSEHGLLPVPAPASVELLKGVPVYSSHVSYELTTPTGAVLISSLAARFGPMPHMNIAKIGVGAGSRNFKEQPNILRMFVGSESTGISQRRKQGEETNEVAVIETNIDDMNPQVYEYVIERLLGAGALDVFLAQGIMKKGRPGIQLSVLCTDDKKDNMIDILLRETTSIGVRFYKAERKILEREIKSKITKYGDMKVKMAKIDKKNRKSSAEYEDCKKIARKFKIPLIDVIKAVNK